MRLNRDIRYQISTLLVAGHQQKVIAKLVGFSEGGLSKEISRNGGRKKYDPDKADKMAVRLQHKAHIHYEYSDEVWAETEALIKEDLSPEQVIGRRGLEGKKSPSVPTVSDPNENMNGLIRQYLPKGTSFEDLTREEVKWIERKLNNRPRKRLGFLTPLEYISRQVKQIYLAT